MSKPSRVTSWAGATIAFAAAAAAAGCGAIEDDSAPGTEQRIGANAACDLKDLRFTRFPLDGVNGHDWIINNYVDLDSSAGLKDFMGKTGSLARTIPAHRGLDIVIPSMREMDDDTAKVFSITTGTVIKVVQDQGDRQTTGCPATGDTNRVEIQVAGGYVVHYLHLKKNSVPSTVREGRQVWVGTQLGVAGSSGCSTDAHLHLEVTCGGTSKETFAVPGVWSDPPAYDPPSNIMDGIIRAGGKPTMDQMKDPPPDAQLLAPTTTVGFGAVATVRNGDWVTVELTRPNGDIFFNVTKLFTNSGRFQRWLLDLGPFSFSNEPQGTYMFKVGVGGFFRIYKPITVGLNAARHGVPSSSPSPHLGFQGVFDQMAAAGFKPVWIDGYDVNGPTFYNLVWEAGTHQVEARAGLSSSAYQTELTNLVGAGFRLAQVDSYLLNGQVAYSAVFDKKPAPLQKAYHGVNATTHQTRFEDFKSQGFQPVNIAVVVSGGQRQFTALYEKKPLTNLRAVIFPASSFVSVVKSHKDAGRSLAYIDAFLDNTVQMFSAIFDDADRGEVFTRHDMTADEYQAEFFTQTGRGLVTRRVTGSRDFSQVARFAAMWSER